MIAFASVGCRISNGALVGPCATETTGTSGIVASLVRPIQAAFVLRQLAAARQLLLGAIPARDAIVEQLGEPLVVVVAFDLQVHLEVLNGQLALAGHGSPGGESGTCRIPWGAISIPSLAAALCVAF